MSTSHISLVRPSISLWTLRLALLLAIVNNVFRFDEDVKHEGNFPSSRETSCVVYKVPDTRINAIGFTDKTIRQGGHVADPPGMKCGNQVFRKKTVYARR